MSCPPTITVAGVQLAATPRAWEANTARAAGFIGAAAEAGAHLVLLPELFAIGAFHAPDLADYAEPATGRTARWLLRLARAHRLTLAGTILERRRRRLHNSLLVAEPTGGLLRYAKRHLGPAEAELITAGDDPNPLTTAIGRLGCLICSDAADAALRQQLARASVALLLVPQATGSTERLGRQVEAGEAGGRRPRLGAIVRQLGAPAVTAGLVGPFENPLPATYGDYLRGGTDIIDADGRGLAHVPFPQEGIAVATVRLGDHGRSMVPDPDALPPRHTDASEPSPIPSEPSPTPTPHGHGR